MLHKMQPEATARNLVTVQLPSLIPESIQNERDATALVVKDRKGGRDLFD